MPVDHPSHSAQRLRRRGTRLAVMFLIFALVLLGVGSWLLADSQSKDRQQLRDRYAIGAEVATSTLDSLFGAAIGPALPRYAELFSGDVKPAQLKAYSAQSQALYTALLGSAGKVIAASPGAPANPGSEIAGRLDKTHFFAISDIMRAAGRPLIESAVRFPVSPTDARILVSGSTLKVFGPFLSGAVAKLVRYGGEAYVLDGHGAALGAVSASRPKHPPPPDPALVMLVLKKTQGVYDVRGQERFFAAQPVASTRWHIAITIPTSHLYQPASGVSRWLPWVVLGFLGLALLAVGLLVRRAILAGATIAEVNTQLEASQDRLRDRAIELQASNAELQRSNADLEQFAYVASHDLSAPLRAVAGFSQLLGMRYQGRLDGDADEFIGHMQDGVDRMQRIIDDLLAYSRVGRSGLQGGPVDLDAIYDEVLHSLAPEIAERDAVITKDRLGEAWGESGQLSQVLQNLIANGAKFTAPGVRPEVHVSAQRDSERVRVSVRDNGIGIDPEHAERIFKMFQRLHNAEDYPGTGIGLAIAQKIIDRHGGAIVITAAPGGGTVFTFDIPAGRPE